MNDPEINPKLIKLASEFFDSTLSSEDREQLQELLRVEVNRRLFIELARSEYGLNCQMRSESNAPLVESTDRVHQTILSSSVKPAGTANRSPAAGQHSRMLRMWQATAALAGIVLVAMFVANLKRPGAPDPQQQELAVVVKEPAPAQPGPPNAVESNNVVEPNYVARVVGASSDLAWDSAGVPKDVLLRLTPGDQLKIGRGLLALEFGGGATLLLEGPTDLKILDERSAVLREGKVTGRSTTGNFSLLTPDAEVIDIGTEFGVTVNKEKRTEVSVFDGEVHLKGLLSAAATDPLKLTTGMQARIDKSGIARRATEPLAQKFRRRLSDSVTPNLGEREVSLVDVISGGDVGEFRWAGAIDPRSGHWSQGPWVETLGVERTDSHGQFVAVNWNPLVNGVFVPSADGGATAFNAEGNTIDLPPTTGTAWGPVWARRRIDGDLDPLKQQVGRDIQGFWGAGTVSAMLDRSQYAGDGLVGMHANIGITFDLDAIRKSRNTRIHSIRGTVAHLEQTRDSQPFQPNSKADFRLYVDGEPRYERLDFSRRDGDAQFGAEIRDEDRYLTLVVTDGGDGPTYDRIILIDPVLELATP